MKGYKTIIFAALTALVPILDMAEVISLVPDEYQNIYLVGVAVVTALLRVVTTTPVARK